MFSSYSGEGRHKKKIGYNFFQDFATEKNWIGYSNSCDWVKNNDTKTITKRVEAYKQVFRTRVRFPPPPPNKKKEG
jgi:hypothetical protein